MRNCVALFIAAALVTTPVALSAETATAPQIPMFSYDESLECLKAAGVYYIFSDTAGKSTSSDYARQVDFWMGQMRANNVTMDVLDEVNDADYARLQDVKDGGSSADFLAEFADDFAMCTDKWKSAPPTIAQKIESPMPPMTSFTREEGKACMMTAIPFIMLAARNNAPEADSLAAAAKFWADEADKYGDISEEEETDMLDRVEGMFEQLALADTDAELAAFIAPYEADWAECEAKRKAVSGQQ